MLPWFPKHAVQSWFVAHCEFLLFPKVKNDPKGQHFGTVRKYSKTEAVTRECHRILEEVFFQSFEQWKQFKIHCISMSQRVLFQKYIKRYLNFSLLCFLFLLICSHYFWNRPCICFRQKPKCYHNISIHIQKIKRLLTKRYYYIQSISFVSHRF